MTSVTATLEALAALDPAMRVKVAAFIAARAVGIAPSGDDAVAEAAIAVGLVNADATALTTTAAEAMADLVPTLDGIAFGFDPKASEGPRVKLAELCGLVAVDAEWRVSVLDAALDHLQALRGANDVDDVHVAARKGKIQPWALDQAGTKVLRLGLSYSRGRVVRETATIVRWTSGGKARLSNGQLVKVSMHPRGDRGFMNNEGDFFFVASPSIEAIAADIAADAAARSRHAQVAALAAAMPADVARAMAEASAAWLEAYARATAPRLEVFADFAVVTHNGTKTRFTGPGFEDRARADAKARVDLGASC